MWTTYFKQPHEAFCQGQSSPHKGQDHEDKGDDRGQTELINTSVGFVHIILRKDLKVSKAVPWGRKTLTSICVRKCLDTIRQSVSISINFRRLATGWTVWGSNPGGGEIFCTCPDRPWGLTSLLYSGYWVFPGVKQPGHGVDHPPHLAPRLRKE